MDVEIYGKLILLELRNIRDEMKEEVKKICNAIKHLQFKNEKETLLQNSEKRYYGQEKNLQIIGNNFMGNQPYNLKMFGNETNVCCSEPVPFKHNVVPVPENDYYENMFEIPSLVKLESESLHHFSLASYSNACKTDQKLLVEEQLDHDNDSNDKTTAERQANTSTYPVVFDFKSLCESSNCDSMTTSTPSCISFGIKHNKPEENGKSFSKKVNLTQHTGIQSRKILFKCNICNKNFSRKLHLDIHTRSHTGEKPFICDVCNKSFSTNSSLIRHASIHTGEKPFKCDICEKSFKQKVHLMSHTHVHTGKTPYKCDFCKKGFGQKAGLTKHNRIHTGEKPFKCDICNKSFKQKVHLTSHTRIHTGEKPFNCVFCSKSFARKTALIIHIRIHTGEKPFQ